jgi:hypothetical protein
MMAFKDGTKSGGRKKGTPNKRTVLDREEAKEAAKKIAAAAGIKLEDVDAHTLLQLFYRCEDFTPRFRKECAAEALKYEKPALSSTDSRSTELVHNVVMMPAPVKDLAEWRSLHDPSFAGYAGGNQQSSNVEQDQHVRRLLAGTEAKKELDS